jgi:hypothetical protein
MYFYKDTITKYEKQKDRHTSCVGPFAFLSNPEFSASDSFLQLSFYNFTVIPYRCIQQL